MYDPYMERYMYIYSYKDQHLTCTCADEMEKILYLEVLSEYWILGADKPLSQNLKPKNITKVEQSRRIFVYTV